MEAGFVASSMHDGIPCTTHVLMYVSCISTELLIDLMMLDEEILYPKGDNDGGGQGRMSHAEGKIMKLPRAN